MMKWLWSQKINGSRFRKKEKGNKQPETHSPWQRNPSIN
jgi:hypothetical protein